MAAGWPDHRRDLASAASSTLVVAGGDSLAWWVRPAAALGWALEGQLPFAHLAVVDAGTAGGEPSDESVADLLVRDGGPVVRALLGTTAGPVVDSVMQALGPAVV